MHYTVAFVFWIALLIPGFAVVMRWSPDLVKGGILNIIAVSFLASIAFLIPFTIIGFVLTLPLAVMSGVIVAFVTWGLFDIIRTKAWKEITSEFRGLLRLEAAALAFGCFIQGKVGSLMGADALVHMARIRQITDYGLTNVDPFIRGDNFFPIYHTNIYHVLMASCAQLTQVHYLDVWFGALPVVFVLIASAIYFMTYQVFKNRWAAWLASIFFLADQGWVRFLTYPNKVAPFFLFPILIGLAVRALEKNPTWKDAVQIGAASLALGMFHGMYAFFGIVLLGPIFVIFGIRSMIRGDRQKLKYAMCCGALILSAPWPMISRRATDEVRVETVRARIERDRDPDVIQFATAKTGKRKKQAANAGANSFFMKAWSGMIIKKPFRGFGGGKGFLGIKGFRYQYLLLGCVIGLLSRRRRQYIVAASVCGMTLAYLFFPPLCTLLFKIMEAKWMLQRLETTGLSMMFPTLVFGAIAYLASKQIGLANANSKWKRAGTIALQGAISIFLLSFAFSYSGQWRAWHSWTSGSPFLNQKMHWGVNVDAAKKFTSKQCRGKVRQMKRLRKFYQETIPPGSNVIVTDNLALELVTLHDAHILDPIRSSIGVPDLSYYRRLNARILNPATKWPTRKRILKQMDARFYLPQNSRARWLDNHVKKTWGMRTSKIRLVEFDLES